MSATRATHAHGCTAERVVRWAEDAIATSEGSDDGQVDDEA